MLTGYIFVALLSVLVPSKNVAEPVRWVISKWVIKKEIGAFQSERRESKPKAWVRVTTFN
jgi:hypothetical protein